MSANKKNINPRLKKLIEERQKTSYSLDEYMVGIKQQDRMIVSKAISLVESSLAEHRAMAMNLFESCRQIVSKSIKIGISGTPGVGKSTFIDAFGMLLLSKGFTVAVLAVDPSSSRTGGSILGDKTRMSQLSVEKNAYIRPSAAGKTLGGVAKTTRETIAICEAAQYDYILVETVGVGQSETLVSSMVDMYLVLLLPGGGDELQGIKRGIVELADLIVINKSEGENKTKARISKVAYTNGLHYLSQSSNGWIAKAVLASALQNEGIEDIFEDISQYIKLLKDNDGLLQKRQIQDLFWYDYSIKTHLEEFIFLKADVEKVYNENKQRVANGEINPFSAAFEVVKSI